MIVRLGTAVSSIYLIDLRTKLVTEGCLPVQQQKLQVVIQKRKSERLM